VGPDRERQVTEARPRISVVVPFYNAERFLSKCLDGLREQGFPRDQYEIIVVNNNSTDLSRNVAAGYPDVILLDQPVSGSYAARNTGIRHARGEIIATIDPDCRPDSDWLAEIDSGMRDPTCSILIGHQRHASQSRGLELLELYEAEKIAYVTKIKKKELYFGYTNNMAFRRTLFDTIGLFPERVRGGDTMFVRMAVDRLGCDVVRFNCRMKTTHLEVDTLNAYYSKRMVYGQSNERLSKTVRFRPLRNLERLKIFASLAKTERLTWKKSLLLLALLAPGALLYEAGRRKGMLKLR
jgi:glycosyltransferase involved in cell wall biosynthesis